MQNGDICEILVNKSEWGAHRSMARRRQNVKRQAQD